MKQKEQPAVLDTQVSELIIVYNEYIKLLGDEIHDLAIMASVRGWKSNRYEKGAELRSKIIKLTTGITTKPSFY